MGNQSRIGESRAKRPGEREGKKTACAAKVVQPDVGDKHAEGQSGNQVDDVMFSGGKSCQASGDEEEKRCHLPDSVWREHEKYKSCANMQRGKRVRHSSQAHRNRRYNGWMQPLLLECIDRSAGRDDHVEQRAGDKLSNVSEND